MESSMALLSQEKFADHFGTICPACKGDDIEFENDHGDHYGVCLNEECNVSFDIITEIVGYGDVYDENGDLVLE
jgi:hypothetical protein